MLRGSLPDFSNYYVACHKMQPSAGQGATNAMQDAVILANCLYDLRSNSIEDITKALKSYKDQRYPRAKAQFDFSQKMGHVMYGHIWSEVSTKTWEGEEEEREGTLH